MVLLGALLVGCGSEGPPPEPPPTPPFRPPDVLVILWDTVRADHLSTWGYARPTTPRLDAFAADAAVYEQAISPGMWTVPAHGSLFTGLPATSHGARVGWTWLDGHHLTLAEHLVRQGYRTWAWSSNPYLSDRTNLLQGFETVRYAWREQAARCGAATQGKAIQEDRSTELSPGRAPDPTRRGWPEHLVATKDCAQPAVDDFLEWQASLPAEQPYFAYLNLLEAHHPRVPSRAAREAVAGPADVAASLETDLSLYRTMAAMEGVLPLSDTERAGLNVAYDASLRELDDATGRLLDRLRERGVLDHTLVVITSDHGENLGERGMYDHRWDLHQSLVHVPLVVRLPGTVEPGRTATPVSTGHLFGTVLALTGLPAPPDAGPFPPFGVADRVFSELEEPMPRLPEVRTGVSGLVKNRWNRRFRKVVEGGWALLQSDDGWSGLYDLNADPEETTPVNEAHPDVVVRLTEALEQFEATRPKVDRSLRTAEDRPGSPLAGGTGDEALLEALGYAEAGP